MVDPDGDEEDILTHNMIFLLFVENQGTKWMLALALKYNLWRKHQKVLPGGIQLSINATGLYFIPRAEVSKGV